MNIQEAKKQIKEAISIYLKKDSYGNYRIPIERQRPIFLIGAPGIGKTAIMSQIANELDIGLVAYSMTHHTRQSALGLPRIVKKEFRGTEYVVSEYTMSEIIAKVYETIEKSGKEEGILFLDEINCVSETLTPSMLQFLQYKVFGSHRVPEGWIVVTAGNPPEYNRSVHEFDIVTLDRLKVMEIEPDYSAWKAYARQQGIHSAIVTYLDIRRDDFYKVVNTADGASYVTARGWEDLSEAIYMYEESGFAVDEALVSQYICDRHVAGEFITYYDLYRKYDMDYQVRDILDGKESSETARRAKEAGLDERITLLGLITEALAPCIRQSMETQDGLRNLQKKLVAIKSAVQENEDADIKLLLSDMAAEAADTIDRAEAAGGLTVGERNENQYVIAFAENAVRQAEISSAGAATEKFKAVEEEYMARVNQMEEEAETIGKQLKNAFAFIKENLGEGNEMLIFVTELTFDPASARFIAEHGSDEYNEYNRKFMLYERNAELMEQVQRWRHYAGHSGSDGGKPQQNDQDDERAKEAAKQGIAVETIKLAGSDKNKQN
ncbi:MAG: AAA family ATPase [Firmicutes bacterium]|nr:AAA family ATPase [Bacillota bacterium]